jgi:hypothetical protein
MRHKSKQRRRLTINDKQYSYLIGGTMVNIREVVDGKLGAGYNVEKYTILGKTAKEYYNRGDFDYPITPGIVTAYIKARN